jgi:hypothetical protein
MLEPAYLNICELKRIYSSRIFDKKYLFLADPVCSYDIMIDPNDWSRIQYVSKNAGGCIIAYFTVSINRLSGIVERLDIINFLEHPSITLTRDFFRFMRILFVERKFRKMIFYALRSNPANAMYERLAKQGFARKVGYLKNQILLSDGNYHDQIIYEVGRRSYLKWAGESGIDGSI